MSNETFVYNTSSSPASGSEQKFNELQDLLRGVALSINDISQRIDMMDVRLEVIETSRSNKTSKAGTPKRALSPKASQDDKKGELNFDNIYPKTPTFIEKEFTLNPETLLKMSGNFGTNDFKNNRKNNDNNKNDNKEKGKETQSDKYLKKKAANQKNTRESILEHDTNVLKMQYGSNKLSTAVPKTYIQYVPEFKGILDKLDPTTYREFSKAVITHQKRYNTTLQAGSYVADFLVELIIDKNKIAKQTGNNFVSEIEDVFAVKNCTLEELTPLVRIAVAPLDKNDYEEKLKKFVSAGVHIRNGYNPRIHDFQSFSDELLKYLDKFEDAIAFLSGSDIVLPMISKKELDGVEGSVQILYQTLPIHYCGKYLRQFVPYVSDDQDDIISYLKRLRKVHFTNGYQLADSIKMFSKSLVQDYPYNGQSSKTFPKESSYPAKTIIQKNKPGGQFNNNNNNNKDRNYPKLQNIMDEFQEVDMSPEEIVCQQELMLEQQQVQENQNEIDDFNSQLNVLSSSHSGHKPIFDSKTGKTYVPKGCQNPILYESCYLEKAGSCKNLHDTKSVRETAMTMMERATKYLAATDLKKITGGQPAVFQKPSLNNLNNNTEITRCDDTTSNVDP